MRLALQHRSRYLYPRPTILGPHVVRLRPAPHARAHVESYALRLSDPAEVRWLQRELLSIDELREAIDEMWPRLSATQLVEELFASDEALDAAAGQLLTAQERALLRRPAGSPSEP